MSNSMCTLRCMKPEDMVPESSAFRYPPWLLRMACAPDTRQAAEQLVRAMWTKLKWNSTVGQMAQYARVVTAQSRRRVGFKGANRASRLAVKCIRHNARPAPAHSCTSACDLVEVGALVMCVQSGQYHVCSDAGCFYANDGVYAGGDGVVTSRVCPVTGFELSALALTTLNNDQFDADAIDYQATRSLLCSTAGSAGQPAGRLGCKRVAGGAPQPRKRARTACRLPAKLDALFGNAYALLPGERGLALDHELAKAVARHVPVGALDKSWSAMQDVVRRVTTLTPLGRQVWAQKGGAAKTAMRQFADWVCRRSLVLWAACTHAAEGGPCSGIRSPHPGVVAYVLLSLAGGVRLRDAVVAPATPDAARVVPSVSVFRSAKVVRCKKYSQAQKWCQYNLFVLRTRHRCLFGQVCLPDATASQLAEVILNI